MTAGVLVTGASGYLGGRVAQQLSRTDGLAVSSTIRATEVPPPWLSGLPVVPLDLISPGDLSAVLAGVRCIVHLAAANEVDCARNVANAIAVNVTGTAQLVQAATRARVERFVYMSTAHVYGAPLTGTITEQTLPMPVHPYSITHHAAEHFVLAENARGALLGVVLRLSNAIGAPAGAAVDRWTLVANDLCRQAATSSQIVLRGDGLECRDFLAISDVGRAIAHTLSPEFARTGGGVFNVGGRQPMRIVDLADRIADRCRALTGRRPEIHRQPSQANPVPLSLDYRVDKLAATGFEPTGDLDAEIDETLTLCLASFGSGKPARAPGAEFGA